MLKLVTYIISAKYGYKDEHLNIAGYDILLTNCIENTEQVFEQITTTGRNYGLEINTLESSIVIFSMREKPNEITGVKVSDEIKYLGKPINDKRNMFKKHEIIIDNVTRMANSTYSIVSRSCPLLMIGKVYWKYNVFPMVLYDTNIIDFTEQEIQMFSENREHTMDILYDAIASCKQSIMI